MDTSDRDTISNNMCQQKFTNKQLTPKKSSIDAVVSKENQEISSDDQFTNKAQHLRVLKDRYLLTNQQKCLDIRTNEYLLLKIFNEKYDKIQLAYFRLQNENIDDIEHPLVRPLRDAIPLSSDRTYLLIKPENFGNLHSYIRQRRRLKETEAKKFFYQMCKTVELCHRNGVVLRDLKLRKFYFIDHDRTRLQYESLEGGVILENANDDKLSEKIGCPLYVAPEVITPNSTYGGKAADMWALGVLLYTMLVGQYPFNDPNGQILFSKIISCNYQMPHGISSKAKCLIRSLLRASPEERLTSEDIFYHPWFTETTSDYVRSADGLKDQVVPEMLAPEESYELT